MRGVAGGERGVAEAGVERLVPPGQVGAGHDPVGAHGGDEGVEGLRAADVGVVTSDLTSALRSMVGGDDRVSRYLDPTTNEDYDVQLRLTERDRHDPATIGQLFVPSRSGALVRLDNLVRLLQTESPSRIE